MSEPLPLVPVDAAVPRPEDGDQDVTQDPTDVYASEEVDDDGEASD